MASMDDSVTGNACGQVPVVGGYLDGGYGPSNPNGWTPAAWALYPNSLHVGITVEGLPGAKVADCEAGAMGVPQTVAWALAEVEAGRRPTIYADWFDWINKIDPALAQVHLARGVNVDAWVAKIGPPVIPQGFVAIQYAQNVPGPHGHNIDMSVTNDVWPANAPVHVVTPNPPVAPVPEIVKQLSGKAGNLNAPIVAIVSTPSGQGYIEVGADGGTFNYGDAPFLGSLGGLKLNAPIVDAALTTDGKGLWLVATDGGVFCFGGAGFHGSMGGTKLAAPVVSIKGTPSNQGYWLVGADGGIFAFGDAGFHGTAA